MRRPPRRFLAGAKGAFRFAPFVHIAQDRSHDTCVGRHCDADCSK
jgi:hypothetical protein